MQQPGSPGRFGLGGMNGMQGRENMHPGMGRNTSPGRFGQPQGLQNGNMSPGRYGQPLQNGPMNPSRYGQNSALSPGRFGNQNIPGLNQQAPGQAGPHSPGRQPYSPLAKRSPYTQPSGAYSPHRPGSPQPGNLRDRLGGAYSPHRPGATGLRDRYAGALNQDPRAQAPGLNGNAYSPGRQPQQPIGSPGRVGLSQVPQPTQAQSQIPSNQDGLIGSPVRRFGQNDNTTHPIKVYGNGNNLGQSALPQNQQQPQNTPLSPINRSSIPLNDRINPNFNANAYSPGRASQQPPA